MNASIVRHPSGTHAGGRFANKTNNEGEPELGPSGPMSADYLGEVVRAHGVWLRSADPSLSSQEHRAVMDEYRDSVGPSRLPAQPADLAGADLSGADLSGVNLTGADFTDANLAGARLDGAILMHATFHGADIDGASFEGAQLGGASFLGSRGEADFVGSDRTFDEDDD